ncbi:MAG TPA: class I SAM-dependent methyltransferase [Fimbriimonadaceae bacterium]|nr:class I SAM-dependent methyltransferase [Fimbriimonadaceae bacterium]
MAEDWSAYFKASLEKPLHPLWKQIDPFLRAGAVALDLGCGAGEGTLHLLEMGLSVIAVDQEPEALEILRERLPEAAKAHLVKAQFQDIGFDPDSLDVVVAFFSLFFLRHWEFGQVWQRLLTALKPGGLFAGQLLGVNDDWAERGCTVHTRAEVESLLHPFEILYFEEADRDGETLLREPKHWHVFHVVARKLAQPQT